MAISKFQKQAKSLQRKIHFFYMYFQLKHMSVTQNIGLNPWIRKKSQLYALTLKAPVKNASEIVICWSRLLQITA